MTNLQKIESIITNREPLEEHNIDFIFHAIYDYIIDSGYDKKNIKIAKDYLGRVGKLFFIKNKP